MRRSRTDVGYPLHDFYEIFRDCGELYLAHVLKFGEICSRVFRVTGVYI